MHSLLFNLFVKFPGPSGEEVLYGTSDGKIGLIQLGRYVLYSLVIHAI